MSKRKNIYIKDPASALLERTAKEYYGGNESATIEALLKTSAQRGDLIRLAVLDLIAAKQPTAHADAKLLLAALLDEVAAHAICQAIAPSAAMEWEGGVL